MPACPMCLGDGSLDFRDSDADLAENYSDRELAHMREAGLVHPLGIVPCEECEATGVVSPERHREMMGAATAAVDQILARLQDDESLAC